jgi:hypothetical protein
MCGVWVSSGQTHYCSGIRSTDPIVRVSEFSQIMAKLDAILAELRRRP